jgi:predicted N-acetyltransferase YhbS/ubiquinone/menaquinone biosynthesis C-methylase UbiE
MYEYDLIVDWYAADRRTDIGVPEITALISSLPPHATVLDVGCGNGVPLTRALLQAGCHVVGVDSSSRMLERFRVNCPDTPAICSTIQSLDSEGKTFDAVVAWGVMFHLPHEEQAQAIAKVSNVLKPGGLFLFTSGDEDGSIEGKPMNGVPFRYFSFSIENYRRLLAQHMLALLDVHRDGGDNIYYLARRQANRASCVVRPETPRDVSAVHRLNEQAFGQPLEANLVEKLRRHCGEAISLVAESGGQVLGHILFTPVVIAHQTGPVVGMGLGPMAVLPERQRQGIGSELVRHGLDILRERGCPFVIVVGHPEYYPRFGFERAVKHGLRCQWESVPDAAFMVLILDAAAMADVSGVVTYRAEFSEE